MFSVLNLKQFVNDRLAAAAEEIFGVFQQTVSELENELDRQRELLDVFRNQPVVLLKTTDVQQLQVTEQEDSSEQECRPSQYREEAEPSQQNKDKQVDVFLVKIEDKDQREKESSTSSLIQHIKTEAEVNCGGSEQELHTLHQPDHQMSLSSESDTDDSEDWSETIDTMLSSNPEENPKVQVSEKNDDAEHKSLICPGFRSKMKTRLTQHLKSCSGSLTCSSCGKCFEKKAALQRHLKTHPDEKSFICSHCGNCFQTIMKLRKHMFIHTERPFSCSLCGKCFKRNGHLNEHMKIHIGEKPFHCYICNKDFIYKSNLNKHMRIQHK